MGSGFAAGAAPRNDDFRRYSVLNCKVSIMNPQCTVVLLDELETLGFTNEAFWRLCNFREREKRGSINSHKSYCEGIGSFKDGDNNECVQVRLEMVLKYYRLYYDGHPEVFTRSADAAYCMVPALAY
jgi:hypothetical protein